MSNTVLYSFQESMQELLGAVVAFQVVVGVEFFASRNRQMATEFPVLTDTRHGVAALITAAVTLVKIGRGHG
jgi:hypothetical protein